MPRELARSLKVSLRELPLNFKWPAAILAKMCGFYRLWYSWFTSPLDYHANSNVFYTINLKYVCASVCVFGCTAIGSRRVDRSARVSIQKRFCQRFRRRRFEGSAPALHVFHCHLSSNSDNTITHYGIVNLNKLLE